MPQPPSAFFSSAWWDIRYFMYSKHVLKQMWQLHLSKALQPNGKPFFTSGYPSSHSQPYNVKTSTQAPFSTPCFEELNKNPFWHFIQTLDIWQFSIVGATKTVKYVVVKLALNVWFCVQVLYICMCFTMQAWLHAHVPKKEIIIRRLCKIVIFRGKLWYLQIHTAKGSDYRPVFIMHAKGHTMCPSTWGNTFQVRQQNKWEKYDSQTISNEKCGTQSQRFYKALWVDSCLTKSQLGCEMSDPISRYIVHIQ